MGRWKNCRCRKRNGFPIGAILIALGIGIFIANINLALDIPVIIGGELGKYIGEFSKELARGILEYAPQCSPEVVRLAQIKRDAAAVGVSLMISARYLSLTEDD